MNDIASTSGRIQTSAEDRLFLEESKIEEVIFVPSCDAPKASNVRHVELSRALSSHMHTRSTRDP